MPNKQSHNAFYYFMLDFKERQGRQFKSLREVSEAAGPFWNNLPKEKRRIYEERARAKKGALKASKLNSDQMPVDEIEQIERQEIEFQQQMKDEIQTTLIFAMRSHTLKSNMFFIIHINSFCQHEQTKDYSPCEIAITGFSLKDGVLQHNIYHSMIKPGRLPLGYVGIAQQHANETHQIELPMVGEDAEDNQEEVFSEIMEFLSSKKKVSSEKFPVLYAADKNYAMVKTVFETWCQRFDVDFRLFQIFNLQCMFRILRNTVAAEECWPSDTMSYQEIEKDVYNYTPDIACDFHQMADALVFCSRSIVVRYAYIICDNCCKDANIELIPGCHVPGNSMIVKRNTNPTVTKSKKSSTYKNLTDSSIRDDSSDAETVISIGRSSIWETSSSASIAFPELNRNVLDRNSSQSNTVSGDETSTHMSGGFSYAGATNSRTGSSGLSKRPAALPFSLSEGLSALSISQDSMDNHFPKIGAGRARPMAGLVRGKGRGHPFKKHTSE